MCERRVKCIELQPYLAPSYPAPTLGE